MTVLMVTCGRVALAMVSAMRRGLSTQVLKMKPPKAMSAIAMTVNAIGQAEPRCGGASSGMLVSMLVYRSVWQFKEY